MANIFPVPTNFKLSPMETVKSNETEILLSNDDFLTAIFGNKLDEIYPLIVSFIGNPAKVPSNKWFGKPWRGNSSIVFADTQNNYFSLALFRADASGQYRRIKSFFYGLYAVMLDDIGSKVNMERLTLAPNWLLETSPGNYQAGYMLDEPLIDGKTADQLMDAIINAGLCDPGANGPTSRLARLPVAVNGKYEPSFSCRLKIWSPEKRYSVQELVNGLQLEIIETNRLKRKENRAEIRDADSEQIWTPRPKENTVLIALRNRNLYKSPLGDGKHDITCPWVNEHTNGVDHGTGYFEPDDNYPVGGLKCQHAHCNERNIRDLLHFLDIDIKSARMKPTIHVVKGEIHRIVDIAERELAVTQQYYQRGGIIVLVYTDPSTNETLIQGISQPALVRALSGVATWEQYDARSKSWVRIDPPARHVSILYDSNSYRYLPVIDGLARQPYLRPDGSLMQLAGYDVETNMFGVFDGRKFLVPDFPSKEEAKSALKLLNGLLEEFCFATKADHSAALSAILTAAIRPSLAHAPMMHVRAHAVGSGKSYLCALITAFATPQRGTPTTFPENDEECRKFLLAEYLRGPAVIEFDNLTTDILPYKSLCTVVTSEFMSGRILGLSKTATVSTRSLLLSSGNNVTPIKDMTRRCITINLNPEVEIPAARTYKRPNLISEILQERERYVSAALTIIRAWIIAEKPRAECKSLAGFTEWSDLCRQTLIWLDYPDPALSIFNAITEDPDREQLGRLLTAWQAVFGNIPTMVREAVSKSTYSGNENNELKEILHDIADERGEINRHRLGRWIKRHAGQIVNGLRFVSDSCNTSAVKWKIETVSSILSHSNVQYQETVSTEEEYRRLSRGE
ncbi:hypothetical protein [Legionella septentrionalis]|uniref:hypothetical protein n=1 Tax=Legionella septentrionalis TaxID=2498109 RepID=UPI0018F5C276|nr:hypothetical protein [Legionella septentrionalis]